MSSTFGCERGKKGAAANGPLGEDERSLCRRSATSKRGQAEKVTAQSRPGAS
jgi:hypothetical protein